MELWLIAGFLGPLVGFFLGIAITYAILKRFSTVRNFIFDSLVRDMTASLDLFDLECSISLLSRSFSDIEPGRPFRISTAPAKCEDAP